MTVIPVYDDETDKTKYLYFSGNDPDYPTPPLTIPGWLELEIGL